MDVLDISRAVLQYAIAPLGYTIWNLWHRVNELEQKQAVTQVMVDNIREDIKEIKDGVDLLITRQLK